MNRAEILACGPARPSAARIHVIGLLLLALLLQALSPLLHARLQAMHAALTGQRIDVAAFCLPGHAPATGAGRSDDAAPLAALADCQLCQSGAAPFADLPQPPALAAPPVSFIASASAPAPLQVCSACRYPAHRPRAPPVV